MFIDMRSPLRISSVKAVEDKIAAALTELTGKPLECRIHGLDFTQPNAFFNESAKMTLTVTAPAPKFGDPPKPKALTFDVEAEKQRLVESKDKEAADWLVQRRS